MGQSRTMRSVSKTKPVGRFPKKTQSKQCVQYACITEASSHEDVHISDCQYASLQNIVVGWKKLFKIKAVWGFEDANVVEIALSRAEVSGPYCLFTFWLIANSLAFNIMPSSDMCNVKCSIKCSSCLGDPFQKRTPAVKAGDSSEVTSDSKLQEYSSGLVGVGATKDKSLQQASSSIGSELSALASSSDADKKQKELPIVTAAGGAGDKTSAGQQSPETQNQSSTSAVQTPVAPQSRNGGGSGACGGTGGEKPPDDGRQRKKPLPPDAPNKVQKDENIKTSTPKIPWNDHNRLQLLKYLDDDQCVTGDYLRSAGYQVAAHHSATTASAGSKPHGLEDDGRLPSSKPTYPAPLKEENACGFNASYPRSSIQDKSQRENRSSSSITHTIFGSYKDSDVYQRPPGSIPSGRSWSPPRLVDGTPILWDSEDVHPNPDEDPPDKPSPSNPDNPMPSISSQPEPLKGVDEEAHSDESSSQTEPELPITSQEIPVSQNKGNPQESSGQGSGLQEDEHSQEGPLKMEETQEANSLPGDHKPERDEKN